MQGQVEEEINAALEAVARILSRDVAVEKAEANAKMGELRARSDSGDVVAQFELGMTLAGGVGVVRDIKNSLKWIKVRDKLLNHRRPQNVFPPAQRHTHTHTHTHMLQYSKVKSIDQDCDIS